MIKALNEPNVVVGRVIHHIDIPKIKINIPECKAGCPTFIFTQL